ncbi:hypothetical protein TI39_contig3444g00001, partial [Zymoseptoria brevis]
GRRPGSFITYYTRVNAPGSSNGYGNENGYSSKNGYGVRSYRERSRLRNPRS